jgi:DNA-binding NarL/FixJ family response regulator
MKSMIETALNPGDASVLMVEDSPNDQMIGTRALKNFGIRHWRLARTAEDGLEEAARCEYDVVLVDYRLPGMNGLEFLERLRDLSPATRTIFMTGARQESVAVAAMKLGVSDYIIKDEYLTSHIVRSLQAALRERVASGQAEQREGLSVQGRLVPEASIEGAWLLHALDERHGYWPAGQSIRDALGDEWNNALQAFAAYVRAGAEKFPEPATDSDDALIRVLSQMGVSPRDLYRLYVAAVREVSKEAVVGHEVFAIRPIFFLTHIMACLIEEQQVLLSLSTIAAPLDLSLPAATLANAGNPEPNLNKAA